MRSPHYPRRLEAACARALAVGDQSYRTIKGILVAGTEHGTDEPITASAGAVGAFLRGPDQFGTDTGIIAWISESPTSTTQSTLNE